MLFKEWNEEFLQVLPQEVLILNRWFSLQGRKAFLPGITLEEKEARLWILMDSPFPHELSAPAPEISTGRERVEEALRQRRRRNLFPHEISIGGQKLDHHDYLGGSGGSGFSQPYECAIMQFFAERGVDFSPFDDLEIMDIQMIHQSFKRESFFRLLQTGHPEISLTYSGDSYQLPISLERSFTLAFDTDLPDERFTFWDEEEQRERAFYLRRLFRHDLRLESIRQQEEQQAQFQEAIEQQQISLEMVAEMQKMMEEALDKACPLGCDLAILEYESEDGFQLNFHEIITLAQPQEAALHIKRDGGQSSASMLLFFIPPETELGIHGLPLKTCCLAPVPKYFCGELTVELLSFYKQTKGETIHIP